MKDYNILTKDMIINMKNNMNTMDELLHWLDATLSTTYDNAYDLGYEEGFDSGYDRAIYEGECE